MPEMAKAPSEVKLNVSGITYVGSLTGEDVEEPVYDLGGRRVVRPGRRGIYIMAGRKVSVK